MSFKRSYRVHLPGCAFEGSSWVSEDSSEFTWDKGLERPEDSIGLKTEVVYQNCFLHFYLSLLILTPAEWGKFSSLFDLTLFSSSLLYFCYLFNSNFFSLWTLSSSSMSKYWETVSPTILPISIKCLVTNSTVLRFWSMYPLNEASRVKLFIKLNSFHKISQAAFLFDFSFLNLQAK